jgi:hypothetical protein
LRQQNSALHGTFSLNSTHLIEIHEPAGWENCFLARVYDPFIRFDRNNQKSLCNRTGPVDEKEEHFAARSRRAFDVWSPSVAVSGRERELFAEPLQKAKRNAPALVRAQVVGG